MQQRIVQGLAGLLFPPPVGDIRPMKEYKGLYCLRVGSSRVLFEINDPRKDYLYKGHRVSRRYL